MTDKKTEELNEAELD